ncbi:hypothetical protein GUJ93_ZPchr0001g29428 [Zizania palustris]|uniref:Uncharacterized protein n=1 Tax=Zizania palustris TaxID=103762 RepID=A0A8J5RPT8_ZIZPA|nr:hypothetical protein GUJ93_ZPchr0001g29428 [Zizania palustris]
MEGLIPFIYKAIIKAERRSRTYSRCSSGAGEEDDVWEEKQQWAVNGAGTFQQAGEREMTHRRHRSLEELAGEVGASSQWREGGLPRGKNAGIFSCISGM